MAKTTYEIDIAGVKRSLPLFPVGEDMQIAAFIIFGDVEVTIAAAKALLEKAPEHDIIFTAECKSLPLVYEMARQEKGMSYVIARKGPKVYMRNIIKTNVHSITTKNEQILCMGEDDVAALKGKRVLIVDDVFSTGESLLAMENLVKMAGGNIVGKMAVLAEGDANKRDDITVLAPLPLFDAEGEPVWQ